MTAAKLRREVDDALPGLKRAGKSGQGKLQHADADAWEKPPTRSSPLALVTTRLSTGFKGVKVAPLSSARLFSKAFHSIPQPMSITTLSEGKYIDVNDSFLSVLGYKRDEVIGRTSLDLGIWINREQREDLVRILEDKGQVRDFETNLLGKRGVTRVWLSSAEIIEIKEGRCILITSSDITERKGAEQRLLDVSGRLIRAQEEERSRIARELHDGLNQRLALLSIEVEQLSQSQPSTAGKLRNQLRQLGSRVHEISADVHRLSHQLHPSKLDHLGLVAAVRSLCREISVLRGMRIEFHSSNVPAETHKELALCLFRIAQEALSNVITHSGALMARVELTGKPDALLLRITDSGKGFDLARAKLKGRLGLISMEERLRLVGGTLVVRSKAARGTQIEARVPLIP